MNRTKDKPDDAGASSGAIDNSDVLEGNEYDRDGAGEIDGAGTSTVGAPPKLDHEHTSAGN